jgi:hypothetical protein
VLLGSGFYTDIRGMALLDPMIARYHISNSVLQLTIEDVVSGRTHVIETAGDISGPWNPTGSVETTSSTAEWSQVMSGTWTQSFYRITVGP